MNCDAVNIDAPKEKVSFWEFLGLIVLFAIPMVGFISCIIFMFSSKRAIIKTYARAALTWIVISFITVILVIFLLLNLLGNLILPTINSKLNTEFKTIYEVVYVGVNIMSENYSKAYKAFTPQLTNAFGEEYEPLIQELTEDKYNALFAKIIDGDYVGLLEDFESGKFKELEYAGGEQIFNDFVSEIEAIANGEPSELFDSIEPYLYMF